MSSEIQRLFSKQLSENLFSLHRDLHRKPELSCKEHKTARRLHDELAKLRPVALQIVAETGVVARIKGKNPNALVVAIRGDIDALPIVEATGLPYSSENNGVMHACGHDVHATWAVGAAALLTENPARGDVVVILQPAEEVARGALSILKSGALDGVKAIFGAHVDRRFAVGQVVAQAGPLAASSDTFEIKLFGQGAHGARPHEARDPIVAAAALIMALQTLVSRRLPPDAPGVVTVGSIQAGKTHNIIPAQAVLTGTIRATEVETRAMLKQGVSDLAISQAKAFGLEADVRMHSGTPPIINPPETANWARQAVASVLGEEALVPLGIVNMAAEDFAWYMQEIPGCFLRVGAREAGGEIIPAHSPKFYAAEESIFVGAAVLAEAARVAFTVV